MLQKMIMGSSDSGGGAERFIVSVGHSSNQTTVYYDFYEMTDIFSAPIERGNMTKSFSASDYGGVFDTTVQLSSSLSVRMYSTSRANLYLLVDVIKNGTTISSAQQVPTTTMTTGTNLSGNYFTAFVVEV